MQEIFQYISVSDPALCYQVTKMTLIFLYYNLFKFASGNTILAEHHLPRHPEAKGLSSAAAADTSWCQSHNIILE
jgi:hypothetical protein